MLTSERTFLKCILREHAFYVADDSGRQTDRQQSPLGRSSVVVEFSFILSPLSLSL